MKDIIQGGDDDEGNEDWDVAFSTTTTELSTQIFSSKMIFVPVYDSIGRKSDSLKSGDVVRVEVYPMVAAEHIIDMQNRTGALYMASKNFIVP